MEGIAKYQCLDCDYEFKTVPQPVQCPRCECLYLKWLNYSEFERQTRTPKKSS